MQSKKTLAWLVLVLLVALTGSDNGFGETSQTHRILFIGNSYTYYNSMPQLVKAMAENQFPDQLVETKFIGGGGATLKKHWDVGQAIMEINTGQWDYVVLQGQSMLGLSNLSEGKKPVQFLKYARMFDREIKKNGAQTVLLMTWSRRNGQPPQKLIADIYQNIAEELHSQIAPVGLVWDIVRRNKEMELYSDDGSHPAVTGSYLAALTVFSTIFEVIPQAVSGQLEGLEILRGGKLAASPTLLCDLPAAEVSVLEAALFKVLDP